jgi:hypothetical protein
MKYLGPKTDGDDLATQSDVTGGGAELSDATPDAITPDQAGSAGTATEAARADHSHAITAGAPSSINATQSNSEGNNTTFARSDHLHSVSIGTPGAIQPDDSASAGSSSSLARSDHRHSIAAAAPSSDLTASTTNAEGTSTSFARADHSHAIAAASAGTITGTNAEGTSTSFARADHDHAFGAGSIPQSALALGPTYETSLPGSPVDGQEIYYAADATNGVIWHLRYRSAARSGSGAWEFIGGSELFATGSFSFTSSDHRTFRTYGGGPSISVPLKGTYVATFSAQGTGPGSGDFLLSALKFGSATTLDSNQIWQTQTGSGGAITGAGVREFSLTSALTVAVQHRCFSNNQGFVSNQRLLIKPRFVYA